MILFCVISLGVSKDLVHELPRSPGRASTPYSVVYQGPGPTRPRYLAAARTRSAEKTQRAVTATLQERPTRLGLLL